jgi:anti-sigma factor RsiW
MDCNRIQTLLDGYVDGELDLVNALEIEEHLGDCPGCAQRYAELMELLSAISTNRNVLYRPAPAALRKKIQASVRKMDRAERGRPRLRWGWAAAAVLVVALLVLATGFASGWFASRQDNQLAQEVESAHVRSLMANHLTDITSTDQHTVKPWFDGRLDFSPPVVDLKAQGYPLIGGRLDYLQGHPVASLVYMRNKHVINLFLWPSSNPVKGVQESSSNGYNLFHWRQGGMEYWATSDLNTTEMHSFVGLVQEDFKSPGD